MESHKRKVRGLITRKCISKGMSFKCIQKGVERGVERIEQGKSVRASVREGIAVAVCQQKLTDHKLAPNNMHSYM